MESSVAVIDPSLSEVNVYSNSRDDQYRVVWLRQIREEVDRLRRWAPSWRADPLQPPELIRIRRSFYVLRDTGRLLRQSRLHEFSGCIAVLLDDVLNGYIRAHPEVVALVQHAVAILPQFLLALSGHRVPEAPRIAILETAHCLMSGQSQVRVEDVLASIPAGLGSVPMAWMDKARRPDVWPAGGARIDDENTAPMVCWHPLEPVLAEILRSEAAPHLHLIGSIVSHDQGALKITGVLQRAVHALNTVMTLVNIPLLAPLLSALESTLERLWHLHLDLSVEGISVLTDSIKMVWQVLFQLDVAQPTLPNVDALIGRLQALPAGIMEKTAPATFTAASSTTPLSSPYPWNRGEALPLMSRVRALSGNAQLWVNAESSNTRTEIGIPADLGATPQTHIQVRIKLLAQLLSHASESAMYHARLERQVSGYRMNLRELDQFLQRLRDQLHTQEMEIKRQHLAYRRDEGSGVNSAALDAIDMDFLATLGKQSRELAESVSDLTSVQMALNASARHADTLLTTQSRVHTQLHENMLRTRLLPFATLVPSLRRTVSQLARVQGKQVQLYVEGADREMDRSLLGCLRAPFEHILRNAVAHGIEWPEERRRMGKPAEGSISIRLVREGGELVVSVSDDGRGLDRRRIYQLALDQGFVTTDTHFSDEQLLHTMTRGLRRAAGCINGSTGRSVGMAIIVNDIRQLGGTVVLDSSSSEGTILVLRIPFVVDWR